MPTLYYATDGAYHVRRRREAEEHRGLIQTVLVLGAALYVLNRYG